jgi:hypothetical protein
MYGNHRRRLHVCLPGGIYRDHSTFDARSIGACSTVPSSLCWHRDPDVCTHHRTFSCPNSPTERPANFCTNYPRLRCRHPLLLGRRCWRKFGNVHRHCRRRLHMRVPCWARRDFYALQPPNLGPGGKFAAPVCLFSPLQLRNALLLGQ